MRRRPLHSGTEECKMEKSRSFLRLLVFAVFFFFVVWLWGTLNQIFSARYQLLPEMILRNILYLIMGIILNSVGKRLDFHSIHVNGFRLAVALVCIALVALCYVFYKYLPKEIPEHLGIIEFLLITYAGANLLPAFHLDRE